MKILNDSLILTLSCPGQSKGLGQDATPGRQRLGPGVSALLEPPVPSLCFGVSYTRSVIQMASKRQSSASQEAGIMDDVIMTQLPF